MGDDVNLQCPLCDSIYVMGMIYEDVYDGILFWHCDDCAFSWHRFSDEANSRLHALASAHIS